MRTHDYEARAPQKLAPAVRMILLVAVFLLDWDVNAYYRTMEYGSNPRAFLMQVLITGVVIGLPAALAIAIAYQALLRQLVVTAAIVILSVMGAEGFAVAQEQLFALQCRSSPTVMASERRWWPFSNHHIGDDPSTGFYGDD